MENNNNNKGENMTLHEYIELNNWTIQDFADKIHYRREWISKIINGRVTPSKRLKYHIEKFTDGKVKM